MEVFINCKFARNANLSYENNYLNTENEAIMLCGKNEIKRDVYKRQHKRKEVKYEELRSNVVCLS